MKRVLVTGATCPFGRRLLQRLKQEPSVEEAVGIEARAGKKPVEGITVVPFESDGRELAHFLADAGIDTMIHVGMTPQRSGRFSARGPAEVMLKSLAFTGPLRCRVVARPAFAPQTRRTESSNGPATVPSGVNLIPRSRACSVACCP